MKGHAANSAPLGGAFWDGGAETFINKGTNGRWRDLLTAAECAEYQRRAVDELGAEMRALARHGRTLALCARLRRLAPDQVPENRAGRRSRNAATPSW